MRFREGLAAAIWHTVALAALYSERAAGDRLDEVLLKDIMPSIGSKCKVNSNDFADQTWSYTYEHSPSPSTWDPIALTHEPDIFLAEFSNMNSANANKSWTVRVGSAGNIYSFRGAYGEAIPPQHHPDGEFVDEVFQSVAVNLGINTGNPQPYFMHQAGIYYKDGDFTPGPFFSPSIAKHCEDKECFFGTWGQQAHTPTPHISNTLYFNGYRDCGDGIIEYTTIVHNSNLDPFEHTDYHNTPWGGTRTSVLRDIFLSDTSGQLYQKFPIVDWGPSGATIINVEDTGGFITFTEEIMADEDAFDDLEFGPEPYPEQGGVPLALSVKQNNPASYQGTRSDRWNMYCMKVMVNSNFVAPGGCLQQCYLWVENGRTGFKFLSHLVEHYAWQGDKFFMCTRLDDFTVSDFNAMFQQDDEILISLANVGKPFEDNLALQIVHGTQDWIGENRPKTRARMGRGGDSERDYTVYTTNTRQRIDPGDTYVFTQMIATGRLAEMEDIGNEWVSEVYEDLFAETEMSGTDIHLYANDALEFGAYIDGDDACNQGISRCTGSSVPQVGKVPLFYMTCAEKKYVGSDKYFFSPSRDSDSDIIRSYICDGEDVSVKPTWKLLGYFEEGACDFLSEASYDELFCDRQTPNDPWGFGPPAFFQEENEFFKIENGVLGLPDTISVDVLYFNCSTLVPEPEVVTVFSEEYQVTLNKFVYELFFNTSMIQSSELTTFIGGDIVGEAAGLIKFCTRLFGIEDQEGLPISTRVAKFILEFNLTNTEFQGFTLQEVEIAADPISSTSLEIESADPDVCLSDATGACLVTAPTYQQGDSITFSITPPLEVLTISNMEVNMTSPSFFYRPIQLGEQTFAPDAVSSITFVGINTVVVTTTIVAQFFLEIGRAHV